MQVVVCRTPGQLAIEDRPEPQRAQNEVLIQIRRVGICGTDFHIFEGTHPYLEYPRVMGHEISAEVLRAPESSDLKPGQIVVVNPYISCGACRACRSGKPNCCSRIAVLGVHRDGGMGERMSIPQENLYPARSLSIDQAAGIEFLAIGAHGVSRSGMRKGTRTLVVGAGPIGLGVAIFAEIAGGELTILDRDEARVEFAVRQLGIRKSIVAGEDVLSAVAEATEGEGFDLVIDATGNRASMESGFAYVAHGGVYVLVSVVSGQVAFSDPEFHKREMTVMGSRNALREDFEWVIKAVETGRAPLDRLITHRTRLVGVIRDLPRWTAEKQGLVKALIEV